MAKRVFSISRLQIGRSISNVCVISPAARSGKSSAASVCSAKRECPDRHRQALALGVARDLDLGAVRQLAHDVMQHVRGNCHGTRLRNVSRRLLDHLALEVGRLQLERAVPAP